MTTTTPDPFEEHLGDEQKMETAFNAAVLNLGLDGAVEALGISTMRQLFGDPHLIENPRLRPFVWRPAAATSKILIDSAYAWEPTTAMQAPAILIRANAFQNVRRGVGDVKQGQIMDKHGNPHYVTFWTGSVTCFCIAGMASGGSIQARYLGAEVQRHFTEFASVFQRVLGFKRFSAVEKGQLAVLEESKQHLAMPVTIGVEAEEKWSLVAQAPRLKSVIVRTDQDG